MTPWLLAAAALPATAIARVAEDSQRWEPGIGDPTVLGWLTVGVYVLLAVLALRNARASAADVRERAVWWGLAALLLFLAVNKQLDLQTWFTQAGKDLALRQGWYERRRPVQVGFVLLLAGACVLLILALRRVMLDRWRRFRGTAVGLAALLGFVLLRAESIHHVDRFLSVEVLSVRTNNVIELTACLILLFGIRAGAPRREEGT